MTDTVYVVSKAVMDRAISDFMLDIFVICVMMLIVFGIVAGVISLVSYIKEKNNPKVKYESILDKHKRTDFFTGRKDK